MPGIRFRVKLYGHMGRDDEAFAKKLSVVLAVEESDARRFLAGVPTVVREELGEAQANSLCELLRAIGALCLTEPIENHSVSGPTAMDQVEWAPREAAPDEPKAAERSFSMPWGGLLACAVGLALVFAVFSIWSSYTRMTEKFGPAPRVSEPQKAEALPERPSPPPSASLPELYAEVDEAESNLERLKFIADLREREMHASAGAYRVDRNVVRERRVLWEKARAEIDAEMKKLRELKATIKKVESEQAP